MNYEAKYIDPSPPRGEHGLLTGSAGVASAMPEVGNPAHRAYRKG